MYFYYAISILVKHKSLFPSEPVIHLDNIVSDIRE